MQRTDHGQTGSPPGRVESTELRRMIGFVALISASFDGALRQLAPGLTLSQYAALDTISRAGRLRPFRLATQLRISRQLAWQTCKRLESLGLAEINEMEEGKRGVEVAATPAGAAHLDLVVTLIDRLAVHLTEPGPKGERFEPQPTRRGLRILAHAAGVLQDETEASGTGDEPADGNPAQEAAPRPAKRAGKSGDPHPADPPASHGGAIP